MEELFKFAIEGGSFGVSLFLVFFLSKKFLKKEVIEPIQELKEDNKDIRKSFSIFTDKINSFVFSLMKSVSEMSDHLNLNISNMNNLFTEQSRQTSQSLNESSEALKKVNVMEQTTEKLLKIATVVHEKNKKLESDIHKLSEEFIMIKSRIKKNDD